MLQADPALGHGLYWAAGAQADTLMVGHPASAGHGGDAAHPCSGQLVTSLQVCRQGRWSPLPLAGTGVVTIPSTAEAAFVVIDWGWWVKTRQGSHQAHPDSVAGVLTAWQSTETLRHLNTWNSLSAAPVGDELELLPVDNPLALQPGDKIDLLVTRSGLPVADVPVAYDGNVRGLTGPDGRIRLKLRHPGPQELTATIRTPLEGRAHAEIVRSAVLTFSLETE